MSGEEDKLSCKPEDGAAQDSYGERSIDQLLANVARPAVHAGGGSAAAVSGALAAATAALVAALSATRKSNRRVAPTIERELEELDTLRQVLLDAAAHDEATLDELMALYRAASTSDDAMVEALILAAESTLAIARAATAVCEIAERLAPLASRFIVSDVGAAAAIARGATIAALLTAETNVQMILRRSAADAAGVERLQEALREYERRSERAAEQALRVTRERLRS